MVTARKRMLFEKIFNSTHNLFSHMEETYKFSAIIHKEGKWYVSWCPELDVASQGETVEEAIENLKEAVELYLEDEDVQIPAGGSILTTTIEVSHAKTSRPVST
jgi:predicted RNase H-like HicB family nuclease